MSENGIGKWILLGMDKAIETTFRQFVDGTQPADEANIGIQIEGRIGTFKPKKIVVNEFYKFLIFYLNSLITEIRRSQNSAIVGTAIPTFAAKWSHTKAEDDWRKPVGQKENKPSVRVNLENCLFQHCPIIASGNWL